MRLTKTSDTRLQYIRALIYGDSGVGKTTSLRTLPPDRTTIILTERGAIPLRNTNYSVIQVECWEDVEGIYKAFANPESIKNEELKAVVAKTKILAFDGLSEIATLCKRRIVQVDAPALGKARGKVSEKTYEELMSQEDWGLYRDRMLNLVGTWCHLPMHIIMTCLAEWRVDKQSLDRLRLPNLSGKTAVEVPAYFDLVFYMKTVTEGKASSRVWQTFNDGMIPAKDASGVLDQSEETNWMTIFGKILPKKNNTKQETTA